MRRKVGLFFLCGVVLPLVFAATASAQMEVTPKEPRPGETVTVKTFGGFAGGAEQLLRLDLRTARTGTLPNGVTNSDPDVPCEDKVVPGCVLVRKAADERGSLNAEFVMPTVQPGWHLLLSTSTLAGNGRYRAFPHHARIRVQSASAGAAAPGGRGGLPGSPLGLVAVGSALLLLATGATLTTRRLRTLNRPQLGS